MAENIRSLYLDNSFSISVIIPTYNRRRTLSRSIESVLNQTIKAAEIFVIDDGSTDSTGDWVKSRYPPIKYIYQSNNGVSNARNTGIRLAKSDWIAFLDSDDEWINNKLEEQVKALNKVKELKFCHTDEIWIRNGKKLNQKNNHQKFGGYIFNQCLDKCRISPSTVLCQKSLLTEMNGFDEMLSVCEDYDLWLRITSKYSVLHLNDPLIKKYGGHKDQLSSVDKGIEKYHIQVLEKLIKLDFTLEQHQSIVNTLIKKIKIYASGAEKRERLGAYKKYMKRINELSSYA